MMECCEDPNTVGGAAEDDESAVHSTTQSSSSSLAVPAASTTPTTTVTATTIATTAHTAVSGVRVAGASSGGPCSSEARLYIYCKREQLDARSRMRGNKALR